MSDLFSQFVASAKSIALSETEKAHVRQTLEVFVRDEGRVFSSVRSVSMSVQEKESGLRALREFMHSHPAVSEERVSWIGLFHRIFSLRFASGLMAAIVIFFSVGGAAAYAAENALPGNPLYPLKIYITEPLREHLSLTPRARAAWRAERIVRRLHEEEELLASTPDREKDADFLEERIIHHMEKMEERLAEVESENDKEVLRIRLEGAIRHHEDVLSQWEQHELPMEKVPEFHKRIKQKKQFLRNVFHEHVRKSVKDALEEKEEVAIDEYEDETEESPASATPLRQGYEEQEVTAGREEIEAIEKDPSNDLPVDLPDEPVKEKYVPVPVVLPKLLRKIHREKNSIHRDENEKKKDNEPIEKKEKTEEREKENTPSFFQDLQREIFPSALFKRFPREE